VSTTTIVANGKDGPAVIAEYANSKATWLALRTYDIRDGAGSFLTFQTPDSKGTILDSCTLNGGFWKNQAHEVDAHGNVIHPGPSTSLDIIGYSAGQEVWVSMVGAGDGSEAFFGCGPTTAFGLGNVSALWRDLWLKQYPVPAKYQNLPGKPVACVHINGKLSMLYDP
jgi:hypothetical protein